MNPLFKKLNLADHRDLLIVAAPRSFEPEVRSLTGVTVRRKPQGSRPITFALFFVQTLREVTAAAKTLKNAQGDPVVWFAYPKASSANYACEFNRDTGWAALGEAGFEGVRQVAIDADWSALRFRRVEHIKSMKRDPSRALSKKGKARTGDSA